MESIDNDYVDCRVSYSLLSAWHLKGRYLPYSSTSEYVVYQLSIAMKYVLVSMIFITSLVKQRPMRSIAKEWGVLKVA